MRANPNFNDYNNAERTELKLGSTILLYQRTTGGDNDNTTYGRTSYTCYSHAAYCTRANPNNRSANTSLSYPDVPRMPINFRYCLTAAIPFGELNVPVMVS